MSSKKLTYFFEFTIKNSEENFIVQNNAILEKSKLTNEFEPNNFLNPLYFSYKNKELKIPVLIGGYPKMLLIDTLAQTFPEEIINKFK